MVCRNFSLLIVSVLDFIVWIFLGFFYLSVLTSLCLLVYQFQNHFVWNTQWNTLKSTFLTFSGLTKLCVPLQQQWVVPPSCGREPSDHCGPWTVLRGTGGQHGMQREQHSISNTSQVQVSKIIDSFIKQRRLWQNDSLLKNWAYFGQCGFDSKCNSTSDFSSIDNKCTWRSYPAQLLKSSKQFW